MSSEEVKRRIAKCNQDFFDSTDQRAKHFYCPITHEDIETEHCKGHILVESLKNSGMWVPQREDVDNLFGESVEGDFSKIVQDRRKSTGEILADFKLRKRHRPQILCGGNVVPHYFSKSENVATGHTAFRMSGPTETDEYLVVKMDNNEVMRLHEKPIQLLIDRDYLPEVIASVLKAAHLTMFRLFGYKHVFSYSGLILSDLLGKFFKAAKESDRSQRKSLVEEHFLKANAYISPMCTAPDADVRGSLLDHKFLMGMGSSEGPFTVGVIVPAGKDIFVVFLPTNNVHTFDTYRGFIQDPPESMAVKWFHFNDDHNDGPRWETSHAPPNRIPLSREIPDGKHPNYHFH